MAGRFQDVILRGLRAAQPLVTTVASGTIYYVTDEFVTERASDTATGLGGVWEDITDGGGSGGTGINELTGDVTAGPGTGSQVATLANTAVTPGLYGNNTTVPQITVDSKGRLILAADVPITYPSAGINQLTGDVTAGPGSGSQATIVNINIKTKAIIFNFDGGTAPIPAATQLDQYIPFTCTIIAVIMLADLSTTTVVDIWKDTYANYPPTVGDTITAAAKPTITASDKSKDSTLTGWTTAIVADSTLRVNVDSNNNAKRLNLTVVVTT